MPSKFVPCTADIISDLIREYLVPLYAHLIFLPYPKATLLHHYVPISTGPAYGRGCAMMANWKSNFEARFPMLVVMRISRALATSSHHEGAPYVYGSMVRLRPVDWFLVCKISENKLSQLRAFEGSSDLRTLPVFVTLIQGMVVRYTQEPSQASKSLTFSAEVTSGSTVAM